MNETLANIEKEINDYSKQLGQMHTLMLKNARKLPRKAKKKEMYKIEVRFLTFICEMFDSIFEYFDQEPQISQMKSYTKVKKTLKELNEDIGRIHTGYFRRSHQLSHQ